MEFRTNSEFFVARLLDAAIYLDSWPFSQQHAILLPPALHFCSVLAVLCLQFDACNHQRSVHDKIVNFDFLMPQWVVAHAVWFPAIVNQGDNKVGGGEGLKRRPQGGSREPQRAPRRAPKGACKGPD